MILELCTTGNRQGADVMVSLAGAACGVWSRCWVCWVGLKILILNGGALTSVISSLWLSTYWRRNSWGERISLCELVGLAQLFLSDISRCNYR